MLYSRDSPSCGLHVRFEFDRRSGGFIGTLPDSTAGLLRLKCVLAGITFRVMVSTLELDEFGRFCHNRGALRALQCRRRARRRRGGWRRGGGRGGLVDPFWAAQLVLGLVGLFNCGWA